MMKLYKQTLGILGIWLLITSLFTNSLSFMIWSNTIVGFTVALAAFNLLEPQRWAGIVGLTVGLWLIHSFYFIEVGMATSTLVANNIISGLILVADGYFGSDTEADAPAT